MIAFLQMQLYDYTNFLTFKVPISAITADKSGDFMI